MLELISYLDRLVERKCKPADVLSLCIRLSVGRLAQPFDRA